MPTSLFLASLGLEALPDFLSEPPPMLQLLYIPTAANVYESPDFAREARASLAEMGFQIDDLDLEVASRDRVGQAVAACDVVYVGGGNTYFLFDWVNKSGLREALLSRDDFVYVGASAGAVIACPDIAYIGNLDDPNVAPGLENTVGLGFVDVYVMPHANEPSVNARWEEVIARDSDSGRHVRLRDDQALTVMNGEQKIVNS